MTQWAHMVDGVLVPVTDLPVSARRLDTGQIVYDLAGTGALWLRACGYFDLDAVDIFDPTLDPVARAAIMAATSAATNRQAFLNKLDQLIAALLANNWDFLDAYSDRIWPGQQDAGRSWPQFDTTPIGTTLTSVATYLTLRTNVLAARSEILRTQESYNSYALIKLANFMSILREVLANLITADPTIVPPPDR
jgi:hypothetical protein